MGEVGVCPNVFWDATYLELDMMRQFYNKECERTWLQTRNIEFRILQSQNFKLTKFSDLYPLTKEELRSQNPDPNKADEEFRALFAPEKVQKPVQQVVKTPDWIKKLGG